MGTLIYALREIKHIRGNSYMEAACCLNVSNHFALLALKSGESAAVKVCRQLG